MHRLLLPALALCAACAPVDTSSDDTGDTAPEAVPTATTITFDAVFEGESFDCRKSFEQIGSTQATIRVGDLRLYVHGVQAILPDGSREAMVLDQDDWQDDDLVLLDFEDGASACEDEGSPGTHTAITGTAPSTMVGLAFTIGVPFDRNHSPIDATTTPLLAFPEMLRNATQGYRFLKVDLETPVPGAAWPVHITSICTVMDTQVSCVAENLVEIVLPAFDPDEDVVQLDVGALLAKSDLTKNAVITTMGGSSQQTQPGCQTDAVDPDCKPIFDLYGLGANAQAWITVR